MNEDLPKVITQPANLTANDKQQMNALRQNAQHVVVFLPAGGARILVNPDKVPDGALVNPDLSEVHGVSPSFWKLDSGKVVAMAGHEAVKRLAVPSPRSELMKRWFWRDVILATCGLILGVILSAGVVNRSAIVNLISPAPKPTPAEVTIPLVPTQGK